MIRPRSSLRSRVRSIKTSGVEAPRVVNRRTCGGVLNSLAKIWPLDICVEQEASGERRRTFENGHGESVALHVTSIGNTSTSDWKGVNGWKLHPSDRRECHTGL
ncbi:hypothetical protein AKJ49_00030 [candidate division MSBL1 archaeon SCGC-AAA382A03]|uniref:Uncharacterized protein n=1 Tax=candidate division MSBL1 archaeon SCGC-AAA382A03 TaxID=1698278 RepID=A0A133VH63_9EURY|nr:hypothetical protein AKJ49_00030 [candidate division MSBL1 archaeon SCGC-AAA382A03]